MWLAGGMDDNEPEELLGLSEASGGVGEAAAEHRSNPVSEGERVKFHSVEPKRSELVTGHGVFLDRP